jgi:XisI protein
MDSLLKNRIKKHQRVLSDYITELAQALGNDMTYQAIVDTKGNHYQLVRMGWDKYRFLYSVLIHFDINTTTGSIWLQQNNTEIELDKALEMYGITKKNIVLGFHPASIRSLSDFAAA